MVPGGHHQACDQPSSSSLQNPLAATFSGRSWHRAKQWPSHPREPFLSAAVTLLQPSGPGAVYGHGRGAAGFPSRPSRHAEERGLVHQPRPRLRVICQRQLPAAPEELLRQTRYRFGGGSGVVSGAVLTGRATPTGCPLPSSPSSLEFLCCIFHPFYSAFGFVQGLLCSLNIASPKIVPALMFFLRCTLSSLWRCDVLRLQFCASVTLSGLRWLPS